MNNYLKVGISLLFAAGFLWFAFKDVEFSEIVEASRGASWGWFLPFAALTLFSHFIRAERWRMLFEDKQNLPPRSTLFTGVMFGYLTNIAFPRLGEVTRPIYVARQIDESNTKLIGTVVLERIVDVLSMLIILILTGIFLISDPEVLSNLFGADVTDPEIYVGFLKAVALYGGGLTLAGVILFVVLNKLSTAESKLGQFFAKLNEGFRNFVKGIMAIRQLENWPLFIFHTALIWVCYITMTYIPFYMFDMTTVFDLSYADAIVLTMVSAVGISIPTPGGVGSYHIFIKLALLYLYAVPEVTGLAYATIAHAATLVVVVITSPILLAVEKRLALSRQRK